MKGDFFMADKAKYWSGICYLENMIETWEDDIGDKLQNPYCYCVHAADLDSEGIERKVHVHIIIAFPNTTTKKCALELMNELSKKGCKCCPAVQSIRNIRHMYNYLIHDTEDCRKKGKVPYSPKLRKTGNNFDIGAFEQIDQETKERYADEIAGIIYKEGISNYLDLYIYVSSNYDSNYRSVIRSYSGHFDRLCKGMYQKKKYGM